MTLKEPVRKAPTTLSGQGYDNSTASSMRRGTVAYWREMAPPMEMYSWAVGANRNFFILFSILILTGTKHICKQLNAFRVNWLALTW